VNEAQERVEKCQEEFSKACKLQQDCGVILTFAEDGMPCVDGEPCEPLVPLFNDQLEATANMTEAKLRSEEAEAQLKEATVTQAIKWSKTQLYWVKGMAATSASIREVLAEDLPVTAAILLRSEKNGKGSEGAVGEVEEPRFYDLVKAEHAHSAWDDPMLNIALVDVPVGKATGLFAPPTDLPPTGNGSSAPSDAAEGAHEMSAALACIAACVPAYTSWKAEATLQQLPESTVELSHFSNLLASVPPEQQSIAVVLHCLVEQVACAVNEQSVGSSESMEVMKGLDLLDRAMAQVQVPFMSPEHVPSNEHKVVSVIEGDRPKMARHGVLTGLVKVDAGRGTVPRATYAHSSS
jgi:hypothetical protein